jgi:hypothetical protein
MPKDAAARVHSELVKFALGYPGAWEDHPWGETVAKVKTKVFVFFGKGRVRALGEAPAVGHVRAGPRLGGAHRLRPRQGGLGDGDVRTAREAARGRPEEMDRRELPCGRPEHARPRAGGRRRREAEAEAEAAPSPREGHHNPFALKELTGDLFGIRW